MAKKYYAVKKGHKTGIFTEWSECEKQVKGYSGAEYKSFGTREEAETYIKNSQPSNNTLNDSEKENITGIHIYVDGSYSDTIKCAAYGYVVVEDDREIFRDYSTVNDDTEIRNVVGELQATIEAITWAIKNKYSKVYIHYDYEGIEKWATGHWKAKTKKTISYKTFIEEIRNTIDIKFVKVKAHSGNRYNELADTLAKNALLEKNVINHTGNTNMSLSDNQEFTIVDNKDNTDKLIKFLQDNYKIETREVQNGIQYIIKDKDEQFFITKYNNLRILFQGKPYKIYNDIIIFLSSIENNANTIKEMNEKFYNFKWKDIDLKLYLPKSYSIFPEMLYAILQPSLLEQPTYTLPDYSMYTFPALRTLEGTIKYLLGLYGIKIDNKGLTCFDGYRLQDSDRVKIQNKNNKLAEHIEKMYKYYRNKRHPLFHTTATLSDIRIIENYEDVKIIIREVLELIDEAFDLHNSNG